MAALITLTIDGHALEAISVTGRESVGSHFRLRVRAHAKDQKPRELIGKDFALEVRSQLGETLKVSGIVVGAAATYGGGVQHVDLDLGPEAEVLTHGQTSHVYLARTSLQIAKAVLSRAGVPEARWDTTGTPPERPYTVQHRESDWSFIDRLTREDGLYSFYDHDDGTKLVFAQDSTKAKSIAKAFVHRTHHGLTTNEPWVSGIASRAVLVSDAFATRDRDPQKPKLAVEARVTEGDGKLEVYEWPARSSVTADATTRAKTSLEALRARRTVVTGRSTSLALRCGKIFAIGEGPLPSSLQKLFCIAVEYSVRAHDGECVVQFTAVPKDVRFALPLRRAAQVPLGAETAVVRGAKGQEIDADEHGSVFVQPVWDRDGKPDDTASARTRVGQAGLARSMAIPRVGWAMLVGHHDGDLDRPWVMARLVDGTHLPPYKLPDHMTRTSWQTLTSTSDGTLSEIVFEDKKDAEQITIAAARDLTITVGDNEARTVGGRHVLDVGKDRTEKTDADDKLTITKDQTITVKGAQSVAIEGSRSITVKGAESASVGGSLTEKTKADHTVDVGKDRKLTVSGTMSASAKKGFTREVLDNLSETAAGAWSTQADGGLVITTKGDATETVAGLKSLNGKDGVSTIVKGDLKDTVAAAHAVTGQGSIGESAKGKMKLTIGAALSAMAPQIEIVGESEIVIACGGSTITIKSSEVAIKSALVTVTGPMIVSDGAQVKHNP